MTTNTFCQNVDCPKSWYNVIPDLPLPLAPPLNPGTGQPASPSDSRPSFLMVVEQEMSSVSTIAIPDPVLDMLRLWRPTPLHGAHGWRKR